MSNRKLDKILTKLKENKKENKVPMSFKIDKEISNKIDSISKEYGLSKTEIVEEILKDYF